ncbi:unnamed protein product [Prorocentrum cordatum]|uniref:Helicase C-terminal domain-containing protein n=1 Tax=Prorocentrum cordatum TaxID=2364126 RepID=A0ABN9WV96_9DINO|nr:unnamed protein product [Polarella glacialis]
MILKGQVLVFARSKQAAEEFGPEHEGPHGHAGGGDPWRQGDQTERVRIMDVFRRRRVSVLVATDLASRGLDVPNIRTGRGRTVVSYDAARDLQTHTHRIGRTGRAGVQGEAHTLVCSDKGGRRTAAMLVESMEQTGQRVPAGTSWRWP